MMSPVYSEQIMKKMGYEKNIKSFVQSQKKFSQDQCYLKQIIDH